MIKLILKYCIFFFLFWFMVKNEIYTTGNFKIFYEIINEIPQIYIVHRNNPSHILFKTYNYPFISSSVTTDYFEPGNGNFFVTQITTVIFFLFIY